MLYITGLSVFEMKEVYKTEILLSNPHTYLQFLYHIY